MTKTNEVALLLGMKLVSKAKKLETIGTLRIKERRRVPQQPKVLRPKMMLCYVGTAIKGKGIRKFLLGNHGREDMSLPIQFGKYLQAQNQLQTS